MRELGFYLMVCGLVILVGIAVFVRSRTTESKKRPLRKYFR